MSDQQHDQPHDTPHDPLPSSLSSLFDSPHHHFLPASDDLIDPQLRDDDVAAAATVLELAEADADVRDDATSGSAGAKRPAEDGSGDGPGDGVPKRLRRTDPSPLDVTLVALLGENERLRKVVAALERPDEHQMQQEHEDMLAEATLRELATAAVGGFGFETLQSQLDASALLPLHEVEAVTVAVSAADYLHGLVTQITPCAPAPAPTDPFAWTRAVLEDDIRATSETIARKEDEIDAIRHGTVVPEPEVQDQLALEGQLAMTATLLETVSRNVRVLRDIAARLQESHDEIAADLADKQEELAMLEDSVVADGSAALGQVRGYIEGALKLWREVRFQRRAGDSHKPQQDPRPFSFFLFSPKLT
jgi:hypothetical protein